MYIQLISSDLLIQYVQTIITTSSAHQINIILSGFKHMKDWLKLHEIKISQIEKQACVDLTDYKIYIRKHAEIIEFQPNWSQSIQSSQRQAQVQAHNITFLTSKFIKITKEIAQIFVVGMTFKLKQNDDNLCQKISQKIGLNFGNSLLNKEKSYAKQGITKKQFLEKYVRITINLKIQNNIFTEKSNTAKATKEKFEVNCENDEEKLQFIIGTKSNQKKNPSITWNKNNDSDLLDRRFKCKSE